MDLGQFVLDAQFLFLEIVDDVVIGMWSPLFVGDTRFEIRVFDLERFQMWLSWHSQPSRLAVTKLTLQTDWHVQPNMFSPGAVCVGETFTR
jgi:hypothetical protein